MNGLLIAVGGHLLNAVAFVIDKSLLSSAFKKSGTYAASVGIFSGVVLLLLPWIRVWPSPALWPVIALFGALFVLAMWAFFEALSHAEMSRVVPVVGSLIPVFTLFLAAVLVHERLEAQVIFGLALLILATILLTNGGKKGHRIERKTLGLCVLAAFLFAVTTVVGKYAFDRASFLDVFVLSRLFSVLTALLIPLISQDVRREIIGLLRPSHGNWPHTGHAGLMMIVGQACGSLGFIAIQYAVALGSPTIVNALQAVQYATLVLVAWFGGKKLAALLKEDRRPVTLIAKGFAILLVGIGLALIAISPMPKTSVTSYGITWSKPYAEELGLDPQKGLVAALEDLQVKHIRIPAYWTDIERKQGTYDFSSLDAQLSEIAKHGAKATIAVGSRLPRWPECWVPEWAGRLADQDARNKAQLAYVKAVYEHEKKNPAVIAWQVENEPMLGAFMSCPGLTKDLALQELRWVRGQEALRPEGERRPVYTTDSGELSHWLNFAGETDALGVSVYRVVTSPWLGTLRYWFVPTFFYTGRAALVERLTGPVFVSEFQMEPWSNQALTKTPLEAQLHTFDLDQMRKNFKYAAALRFPSVDFWGIEWWLWMKEKQNDPSFWEEGRAFFNSHL